MFDKIAKVNKHLIELFVNYDCDVQSDDILYRMIENLSKILQGQFAKSEHASMISAKNEQSLKLYSLKIMTSVVEKLSTYLSATEEANKTRSSVVSEDLSKSEISLIEEEKISQSSL